MGTMHRSKDGSFLIGHEGENCPCKPERVVEYKGRSTGRYGSRQGYKQNVTYLHNPLPVKQEQ